MHYYKNDEGLLIVSDAPYSNYTEITEAEYNTALEQAEKEAMELAREEKEEELARLMQELYPEYATQMLSVLKEGV